MHEPYDDYDDYYNDDYDDSHEYDKSQSDWNKFYFKFDMDSSPLSEWVDKMMEDILNQYEYKPLNIFGFPFVSFPVNSFFPNTGDVKNHLYLGKNYYDESVFKKYHFVKDDLKNSYINHIRTHSVHFLQQPSYYKSMFDILN